MRRSSYCPLPQRSTGPISAPTGKLKDAGEHGPRREAGLASHDPLRPSQEAFLALPPLVVWCDNHRSLGVVCFYATVPLAGFDAGVAIGIHCPAPQTMDETTF